MHTMTVGKVKAHFSKALELVQQGEDIVISFWQKEGEDSRAGSLFALRT